MKSYICLSALALLIAGLGCGPRLAETPLGSEETRWEEYIKKSYPGWDAPQTVPPVAGSKGNIESPATANGLTISRETMLIEDVIVTDKTGKVLSETITAIDVNEKFKTYVVEKNDTLWKISKKFYQDGRKWKKIKAANSDVLKGSDKVLPGMSLRIPLP